MKLFIILSAIALSGCAGWSRETKVEETVFQVVSLGDTLQSIQAANHHECYSEGNPIASGLVGSKPSPGAEVAWGAARAGLHLYVTDVLERNDVNPWLKRLWQAAFIYHEADLVHHNWTIGLQFGSVDCSKAR